jgi:hypothetical protein
VPKLSFMSNNIIMSNISWCMFSVACQETFFDIIHSHLFNAHFGLSNVVMEKGIFLNPLKLSTLRNNSFLYKLLLWYLCKTNRLL